jgi:hypothetical protein
LHEELIPKSTLSRQMTIFGEIAGFLWRLFTY